MMMTLSPVEKRLALMAAIGVLLDNFDVQSINIETPIAPVHDGKPAPFARWKHTGVVIVTFVGLRPTTGEEIVPATVSEGPEDWTDDEVHDFMSMIDTDD